MKRRINGNAVKRLSALALAAVMLLTTGCGGNASSKPAPDNGNSVQAEGTAEKNAENTASGGNKTVTMAIISGGDTFNPLAADTNGDDYMQLLMWDRPFITKIDGTIEPHLCTKYEMVDGKKMCIRDSHSLFRRQSDQYEHISVRP